MDKKELMAALDAAGVTYDPKAKEDVLQALLDAHNASQQSNVPPSGAISENSPKIEKVLMECTDVQLIDSVELYVITGVLPDGTERSGSMSVGLFEVLNEKGVWVKEGTILSVTGELRKAGKTTYVNQAEEVKLHTKDGFGINRLNKGSKAVFNARMNDYQSARSQMAKLELQTELIDALSAAKEAGVDQMALASLLKG